MPMSARDVVATYDSAPTALVAFLSQPDADLSVCDLGSSGPHLPALTPELSSELVDALTAGRMLPATWRGCVSLLMKSAPPRDFASLLDEAGPAYRDLLRDPELDRDLRIQGRLYELHWIYVRRPAALYSTHKETDPLFEELRVALRERKLGPTATRYGEDLIAAYDLEHGLWQGKKVSIETLDTLFAAGNAAMLGRFQARLRSATLRDEARRRIVRLHIAASPYPEVKQQSAQIEALLMAGQRNVVDAKQTIVSAALSGVPWQMVLARERLRTQEVDLFGVDTRDSSLDSELALRDVVHARVAPISQPITLCAPAEALDPSPCILPTDVTVDSPFARIDASGTGELQLASKISMKEALPLAAAGGELAIPVRVGGKLVSALNLGLRFERPHDLRLGGPEPGANGPMLDIAIDCPGPSVVSYSIFDGRYTRTAYVEATDVDLFRIRSEGAPGRPGAPGRDGSSGSSGAECQNGADGGSGGPGGDGGPGGNGGNVTVRVLCDSGLRTGVGYSMLQKILLRTITSVGGQGGPGGPGGRGGSGGAGGPARSARTHVDSHGRTVEDQAACSSGYSGNSGRSGYDGSPGPDGAPGSITFAQ